MTEAIKKKTSLDKDLKRLARVEKATREIGAGLWRSGLAIMFLLGVFGVVAVFQGWSPSGAIVIVAAVIGGYMALTIGANDVTNNVGPAVGSKALTMGGALVLAAICEAAGAFIAGGEVVATVSKGIIDADALPTAGAFLRAMMAALLAGALWIHVATAVGAPVSTTHSIVGAVLGAGWAAAGAEAINWPVMGAIAASWVISPAMGGVIAAGLLALIKNRVLERKDKLSAARRWAPLFIASMGCIFSVYLVMKGLNHVWKPSPLALGSIGGVTFFALFAFSRWDVDRAAKRLENRRKDVAKLFVLPLIFSAGLLSFAHGANDVANAIGPLAAIVAVVETGGVAKQAAIPLWVLAVGGAGIALGLALFGPRLIRVVGQEITRLNPIRAFCVALAAGVTVIVASRLGLPVSSTHIAVGGVFGVGFLREYLSNRKQAARLALQPVAAPGIESEEVFAKKRNKAAKRRLVRRRHLLSIAAAWLITVPASALIAATLYLALSLAGWP